MSQVMVDGTLYEVVHMFNANRGIIDDDGAYVFVDRIVNTELHAGSLMSDDFEESSEPARPGDELEMLNKLVKAREAKGTIVDVTAPDGTVTEFEDKPTS